jgi:type I restriction enzyme S subunit
MIQVPDGWEIKPLKSIGTCKNGLTYSPDDIVENGGLLVLRSSNIQNSQIALEDNVFVREDIKLNYKVQENDILVCVRNGSKDLIGKNALITKEVENMAHGAFMTVFHSNINTYVFQIFQSFLSVIISVQDIHPKIAFVNEEKPVTHKISDNSSNRALVPNKWIPPR